MASVNLSQVAEQNALLQNRNVRSSEDEHRMEFVTDIDGVAFINDASSRSELALRSALSAIQAGVVLICGGKMDMNFSVLEAEVRKTVVGIVYLGDHASDVLNFLSDHNMLFLRAADLQEGVSAATVFARPGDAVLFSPGCVAGNENYKILGSRFKSLVLKK
jgi:UDP-N-acetylmuramoylalanine--D-glutamate ligase